MRALTTRAALAAAGLVVAALPLATATAAHAVVSGPAHDFMVAPSDADGGSYDLYVHDLVTGTVTLLFDDTDTCDDSQPRVSPDGLTVVFRRDCATTGSGIATAPVTGATSATVILADVSQTVGYIEPVFDHAGTTVLVTKYDGDAFTSSLYTVASTGGAATALTGGTGLYGGDYSPDGGTIVTRTDDSSFPSSLKTLPAVGGSVTDVGVQGFHPRWSPDGTKVVYENPCMCSISVLTLAGTTVALLPRSDFGVDGLIEYPTWSPDSSLLYFEGTTGPDPEDVYAIDRSGTRTAPVSGSANLDESFGLDVHAVTSAGPAASTYHPIAPLRVLDTRHGTGAPQAKVPAGGVIDLDLSAAAPSATAVVLNVTAVNASSATNVRVYPTPSDTSFPTVSNLNIPAGRAVANLVTVQTSGADKVRLRNASGTVDLIADLAGYYTAGTTADLYTSTAPVRIVDTRRADLGTPQAPLGTGGFVDVQITGVQGVPNDATAVVLNVAGIHSQHTSDLRVYPTPASGSGAQQPNASSLNLITNETRANLVIVQIGSGGKIRLWNANGLVDVIADLAGWFGTSGDAFFPVPPLRVLDTRSGLYEQNGAHKLGTGVTTDLLVSGTGGLDTQSLTTPSGSIKVPSSASAVVANLTAVTPTLGTDIRAYPKPGTSTYPTVSNINVPANGVVPNLAIVQVNTGQVRLRNANGQVSLLADVAGWFGPVVI